MDEEAFNKVEELDKHSFGLIHYLSKFGFVESILFLQKKNCTLDLIGKSEITPLHIALHYGYEELVELFIENNAVELGDEIHEKFNISNLVKNKEKIEMFLRKLSLTQSISNSIITGGKQRVSF